MLKVLTDSMSQQQVNRVKTQRAPPCALNSLGGVWNLTLQSRLVLISRRGRIFANILWQRVIAKYVHTNIADPDPHE